MTPRQKAFADFYIETGNASEAARKAGYSEKTAYSSGQRLLSNVEVSKYISERMAHQDKARVASADEVLQFYSAVVRGEVKDQFGLDPPLADRLKAADSLMKRYNITTIQASDNPAIIAFVAAAKRQVHGDPE